MCKTCMKHFACIQVASNLSKSKLFYKIVNFMRHTDKTRSAICSEYSTLFYKKQRYCCDDPYNLQFSLKLFYVRSELSSVIFE